MIYVMDSSAMIAFLRNEPGAATVAGMLTDPLISAREMTPKEKRRYESSDDFA